MWRFVAARSTGISHLRAGLPCQDWIACLVLPDGTFVGTVADGAGSAIMAERGAQLAVETAIEHVAHVVGKGSTDFELILREAARKAREAVFAAAIEQTAEPRDFASTLLVVIAGPAGGGALQIGDGVIVVSDGGATWDWLFWPQHGEYVNTTRFLTDEDSLQILEVESLSSSITDIAMMTDGLEPLALHYAGKSTHGPFFTGMFRPLSCTEKPDEICLISSSLESFLSSDRVRSRTDDDVSLILATCRPVEIGA
jgi:hypothetical protein